MEHSSSTPQPQDSAPRGIGSNKASAKKNPRENMGDTRICMGTTDEMNIAWSRVVSEDDVREFYKRFYPAYPDQLIEAILLRTNEKLEQARKGELGKDALFTGSVRKADPHVWDYTPEIKQQQLEGQLANSIAGLDRLLVEESSLSTDKRRPVGAVN